MSIRTPVDDLTTASRFSSSTPDFAIRRRGGDRRSQQRDMEALAGGEQLRRRGSTRRGDQHTRNVVRCTRSPARLRSRVALQGVEVSGPRSSPNTSTRPGCRYS
jgi:hypothetical protein